MTLNLQDRRIVTALAGVFMLGLACLLLLGLAVLVLCAMLLNALVSTLAETVTTIGTLYSHTGPLAHLLMLLAVLFGIPYSFKRVRTPAVRFFQHQFARFSAFAQQRPSPASDPTHEDERNYEEGEVIDLDAEEQKSQARTTAGQPHATSKHVPTKSKKQRKQHKKRQRHAMLALTHA